MYLSQGWITIRQGLLYNVNLVLSLHCAYKTHSPEVG